MSTSLRNNQTNAIASFRAPIFCVCPLSHCRQCANDVIMINLKAACSKYGVYVWHMYMVRPDTGERCLCACVNGHLRQIL